MLSANNELVSLKEAAARWNITVPAARKYIAKGLPRNTDGTLTWTVADEWRRQYNVPEKSGNHRFRTLAKVSRTSARREMVSPQPAGLSVDSSAADLLRLLHGPGMVTLANVAKALGMEPAAQLAAIQIASAWLWRMAGGELLTAEAESMDYGGVQKLTRAQSQQADAWGEIADRALIELTEGEQKS